VASGRSNGFSAHSTHLTRERFFGEFRIDGSVLGINEERIAVIEVVDSRGVPVPEFGGTIIVKNSREAFGTWEGVFYVLTRQRGCT